MEMDAATLTQQLAKQADTGTAAIILLLVVLCVICWPHVVSGISRLRGRKTVTVEGDVHTAERQQYVTVGECKSKMCAMDARIDRVADGQQKILDKLDEMDSRSEKRARETHERIDPLVKELAKNIGQVELMKEAFIKAAIGGGKK